MSLLTLEGIREARALRADTMFVAVIAVEFLYALALAPWFNTWSLILMVGLPLAICAVFVYRWPLPHRLRSILLSTIAILFTMLHIQQAQGLIEMHFGIFVAIAFIAIYRDWLPLVIIAALVAVHHITFCYLQHINMWNLVIPRYARPLVTCCYPCRVCDCRNRVLYIFYAQCSP